MAGRVRYLSALKQRLVPPGRAVYTIKAGLVGGLRMDLDLRSQSQLYLGLFERETLPWMRRLAAGITTGVDIGADQGEHTLFLLAKTKAQRVIAIEPDRSHRPLLLHNLALNGLLTTPRLALLSAYVGAGSGMFALDQLLPLIDGPCLIKLDVDGAEASILASAPQLLARPQVRWLIETHSAELEEHCVELLSQAGHTTLVIPNAWWRAVLPELRPHDHNRWLVASHEAALLGRSRG